MHPLLGFAISFVYSFYLSFPAVDLDQDVSPDLINDYTDVYYTLDTLEISEVLARIDKETIKKYPQKLKASSQDKDHTFWILFKLKNNQPSPFEYFINFPFTRTDVVSLYQVDESDEGTNSELLYRVGDSFPFDQRPVDYRSFIMPVQFEAMEELTFLLNADKRKTVDRFPIRVLTKKSFDKIRNSENIRYGLFFGFLTTIFLGSMIAGIVLNKKVILFYGLYALFIGVYLFASLGLLFQYITSSIPSFNYYDLVLFGSWAMVFFSLYSVSFFDPYRQKKLLPTIQKTITYLLIFVVNGSFLLSISGIERLQFWMLERYEFVLATNYFLILIIFIFVIGNAVALIRKAGKLGVLFILGVFSSLGGITYTVLVDNGIISDHFFTDNSLATLTGFLLEMCFFTIAMIMIIRQTISQLSTKADQLKLREVHHRVKNNIQTISSMMGLEAMQMQDASAQKVIDAGRERLSAISKVHQNLYLLEETEHVDVETYLSQLLTDIASIHDPDEKVEIKLNIDRSALQLDQISSIGMIVNEIAINAFKYAFENAKHPLLELSFTKKGMENELTIADNGDGFVKTESNKDASFGMDMIGLLAKQLKGSASFENDSGLLFKLVFPDNLGN